MNADQTRMTMDGLVRFSSALGSLYLSIAVPDAALFRRPGDSSIAGGDCAFDGLQPGGRTVHWCGALHSRAVCMMAATCCAISNSTEAGVTIRTGRTGTFAFRELNTASGCARASRSRHAKRYQRAMAFANGLPWPSRRATPDDRLRKPAMMRRAFSSDGSETNAWGFAYPASWMCSKKSSKNCLFALTTATSSAKRRFGIMKSTRIQRIVSRWTSAPRTTEQTLEIRRRNFRNPLCRHAAHFGQSSHRLHHERRLVAFAALRHRR